MTRLWIAGPDQPDFDGDVFTDEGWHRLMAQIQPDHPVHVEVLLDGEMQLVPVGIFGEVSRLNLPHDYWLAPDFRLLSFTRCFPAPSERPGFLIRDLTLFGWTLGRGNPADPDAPYVDPWEIRARMHQPDVPYPDLFAREGHKEDRS